MSLCMDSAMNKPIHNVGRVSPQGVTRQEPAEVRNVDVGLRCANPTYGAEWRTFSIDEIKAGRPASIAIGPFGSRMKSDCYVSTGVHVVRGTNLSSGREFSGEFVFVTAEKAKELGGANLQPDDLVFPHRGSIGEVGIVPDDTKQYVLSSSLMKLQCDTGKAIPLFMYYFFKSSIGRGELLKNTSQVGTPGIGQPLSSLKSIRLRLPSVEEQSRIANLLGALDDRIALLRETNVTLEAIAQALFKSWFVDFDPVRARQQGLAPEGMDEATAALFPDGFEESELGLVPKDWRVGILSDFVVTSRKQLQPSDLHAELKYVGLEHIPRKSLGLTAWDTADGLESAKAAFSEGDILFGKLRPYFHKVVVAPFDGVCSTDILVCRPRLPEHDALAAMLLSSVALIDYADRLSNGAKMPRVTWKDLAAYRIVKPPQSVVAEYNLVVLPLLEKIRANVLSAQTLAALRDTLLPRLISGQLRLPEAASQLEEATA